MLNDTDNITSQDNSSAENDSPRKMYSKPVLQELDDLRALTLGSTVPGINDSIPGTFP